MFRIALAVAIALTTHPAVTHAGCHVQQQRVVHHRQAVVHQAYVAPVVAHHGYQQAVLKQVYPAHQVVYRVGEELQYDAIAERIARKALANLEHRLNDSVDRHDRRDGRRHGFTHPGMTVAQRKCATCHTEGSAKVAEGAPKLFNGLGEFIGNQEQAAAAVRAAKDGTMPPGGPELEDDDYFAFRAYLIEATSPVGR